MIPMCDIGNCENPRAKDIRARVCAGHARDIYLDVKGLLEAATVEQFVTSARPPRTKAKVGRRTDGVVYFMDMGDLVKIGWSTNVRQRARDLGALGVLATRAGSPLDEKAMHARFGASWARGELFNKTPDLMAFIAALATSA